MTKGRLAWNLLLQLVAMVALGFLLYSPAANWFADRNHNAELKPGPLIDPYVRDTTAELLQVPAYQAHLELLRVTGSEAIGVITYPALGISLPIYHGTSDEVIRKGVGHLYGTSLPVGGPTTHAVLTAHSGLPNAKLFTNLLNAQVGQQFWISVVGEKHYYEVRSTEVVAPGDTESLEIIEGDDWVTLFTCTPIGVNSHRFLVQAQRVGAPDASGRSELPGDGVTAGFPWWLVGFVGGSAAIGWFLFVPPKKKPNKEAS